MKNQSGYRIKVTIGTDPKYQYTAFVAKETNGVCHTWDGAWYTREDREPEQIKVWKTRRGATNWLAQRSLINGTVEAVA